MDLGKDCLQILKSLKRELIFSQQKLNNLRYYDTADEQITIEFCNKLLGNSAKLVTDSGRELGGAMFTLKEINKKRKEDGVEDPAPVRKLKTRKSE
jgi:hypothetical protein